MKTVAFVGFEGFKQEQDDIAWRLPQLDYKVVNSPEEADVLLVTHHHLELAPEEKPWIAVWIKGCAGRFPELRKLKNQPLGVTSLFLDRSVYGSSDRFIKDNTLKDYYMPT